MNIFYHIIKKNQGIKVLKFKWFLNCTSPRAEKINQIDFLPQCHHLKASLTIYDKLLFEVVGGASALFTSSCGFLYKTIDKINKNKIAKIMPKTTFFRTISPHSKS